MEKLIATDKAIKVIKLLKEKHGNILFQQSAGCCDGTVPMCYEADGFYLSSRNVLLGEIEGVPYYVEKSHLEYIKYTQTIVDVMEGIGAAFSLESTEGFAFLIRTKPLS